MYKSYAHPLVRVVHGLSNSWEPIVATLYTPSHFYAATWSLCNRFLAVAKDGAIEVHDAVTLSLLSTFEPLVPETRKLGFSPDGSFLTQFNHSGLTTWDLQTGGSISTPLPNSNCMLYLDLPLAYSMDRKVFAVAFQDGLHRTFIAFHNHFTTHTHFCCVPREHTVVSIWTHNEFLQFATMELEHITIWKVQFTLTHLPEVVKILPVPDEVLNAGAYQGLFLPMLSRLFVVIKDALLVWDAQNSKLLLKISPFQQHMVSANSNGHIFAYYDNNQVFVWMEVPSGYTLHQKLALSLGPSIGLYISPSEGSIALSLNSAIHLWHTKDPILLSSLSQTKKHHQDPFILRFSPTQTLTAFWRKSEHTVIILNLQSGDLQLTIDTGMDIGGLGITESTIVIVGQERIITRNLSMENATNNSTQIRRLDYLPLMVTVSPNLSQIGFLDPQKLRIYDVSTAEQLTSSYVIGMLKCPFLVNSRSLI